MPSLPPANCSSGKSGCLVNTNSASVKNGPQALVRAGNRHNVETIRARATTAFEKVLRVIDLNLESGSNSKALSLHQQTMARKSDRNNHLHKHLVDGASLRDLHQLED